MEQESFEVPEVAELLNKYFISIKVDREERPDIDSVYMMVCQMLTGSGGWPLTILMTPEQKPFYAATYLPKHNRYGQIGIMELLEQINKKWKTEKDSLTSSAKEITSFLNQQHQSKGMEESPDESLLELGAEQLTHNFDLKYGGFGEAPKFPIPHNLLFLLKMYEEKEDTFLLEMVEKTLRQMYRGGIFDHIGGGFSRYSTDAHWLVPHFEKMLYDNALLAFAYLEAYRLTDKSLYLNVAERTLQYIEKELTHKKGGFFCSQDADSDNEEGKYYVFQPDEVVQELGEAAGERFCQWYDIMEKGNFMGQSIPNLLNNNEYENPPSEIKELCEVLYAYRGKRTTLHKDDKILTSWNGLGILVYTKAYMVTGNECYLKIARKAASFVRANLMTLNGKLKVRWRDNDVANEGHLEDYAFYGLAIIELYQADFDVSWLRTALNLGDEMLKWFEDKENGGFFLYGSHAETLISRPKELYDGAVPSGNSMAAMFLIKIAKLTGEVYWQNAANRQMNFLVGNINEYPAGHTMALLALYEFLHSGIHLVCVSSEDLPKEELRAYCIKQKEPIEVLVVTEENQKSLGKLISYVTEYKIPKSGTEFFVCKDGVCLPPVLELS